MNRKQKGFAIIEGLLVFVIVGILAFVGWFVWHGKQSADDRLSNATLFSSSGSKLKTDKASEKQEQTQPNPAPPPAVTAPKTDTTKSSPPPPPPPATVTHPTDQEVQQAIFQALAIKGLEAAYFATYATYTFDLTPGPLVNQPGVSGASASTFVAPQGTYFEYTCSKGGPGVCGGYWLDIFRSNGTLIERLTNH